MSDNQTPFFNNLQDLKESLEEKPSSVLDLGESDLKDEEKWFNEDYEGQLAVDVFQDKENIYVKSTVAGVKPDDLEIYLHNDLLTIRGKREEQAENKNADYFYKECYWGGFSRSIILPVEVKTDKVEATFKNGILTITLPKEKKSKVVNVKIKPEK